VVLGGIPQGRSGGIGPGEPAEQQLQIPVATEALQISDQRQGAVVTAAPTDAGAIGQPHQHQHRQRFASKAFDHAIALRAEPEAAQRVAETGDIAKDGRQDGEMGQGTNAREH